MKKQILLLIILGLGANFAVAQFPIKIPKVSIPKIETPKTNEPQKSDETRKINNPVKQNSPSRVSGKMYDRQMVMDDGFTYFQAEVVKKYDPAESAQLDIGWYLKASLRLLGTFPERSAFRLKVMQNGKQLADFRCEGDIKTKAEDERLRNDVIRQGNPLLYDDYISEDFSCHNKDAVIKEVGEMNVEVYFVNGDTDAEKLVRTYKIGVHKASNVRGNASKPQRDANSYYIQRHAESAVAFAFFVSGERNYYKDPVNRSNSAQYARTLYIYSSYSPEAGKNLPTNPFARCTVNGNRIDFSKYSNSDGVRIVNSSRSDIVGTYTDRLIPKYQRGNPYTDKVVFRDLVFQMPIFAGGNDPATNYLQIEDNPGDWECKIMANGETYRTFRWTVAGGEIVQHAEQTSGNVNLFYDAALIDMEIPAGGSGMDYRLTPMPNAGLFYGIPWKSAEGKKQAASVPTKGNPFEVPSNKIQ